MPSSFHLTGDLDIGRGAASVEVEGMEPTLIDATPLGQPAVYVKQDALLTDELDFSELSLPETTLRAALRGPTWLTSRLLWQATAGLCGLLLLIGLTLALVRTRPEAERADAEATLPLPEQAVPVALNPETSRDLARPATASKPQDLAPEVPVVAPRASGSAGRTSEAASPPASAPVQPEPPAPAPAKRALSTPRVEPDPAAQPAKEAPKRTRAPRSVPTTSTDPGSKEPAPSRTERDRSSGEWIMNAPRTDDMPTSRSPVQRSRSLRKSRQRMTSGRTNGASKDASCPARGCARSGLYEPDLGSRPTIS